MTVFKQHDRKSSHWYQVPILWVCIGILVITIMACVHLILLSLETADVASETLTPASIYQTPDNSPASAATQAPDAL